MSNTEHTSKSVSLVERLQAAPTPPDDPDLPDEAAREIERLTRELAKLESDYALQNAEIERLTLDGIHTCHDQCPRIACVQRREIEGLRAALEGVMPVVTPCPVREGCGYCTTCIAKAVLAGSPGKATLREQIDKFRADTAHLPPLSGSADELEDRYCKEGIVKNELIARQAAEIERLKNALRYWLPDETMIPTGHEIAWNEHVTLIPEHRSAPESGGKP